MDNQAEALGWEVPAFTHQLTVTGDTAPHSVVEIFVQWKASRLFDAPRSARPQCIREMGRQSLPCMIHLLLILLQNIAYPDSGCSIKELPYNKLVFILNRSIPSVAQFLLNQCRADVSMGF